MGIDDGFRLLLVTDRDFRNHRIVVMQLQSVEVIMKATINHMCNRKRRFDLTFGDMEMI